MPPLPHRSLIASAVRSCRAQSVRKYAVAADTTSSSSNNASALFMDAPPAPKVQSLVKMVPYAGKRKPITPGVRHSLAAQHPHLHKGKPLKDLTLAKRRKGGRNDTGRVVNRFVGGGHKQRIRIVDFNRFEEGDHEVVRIEYDPGRSAHIALIKSKAALALEEAESKPTVQAAGALWWGPQQFKEDGRPKERKKTIGGYSYILAPEGLREGDTVCSYRSGIPAGLTGGLDEANINTDPSSPQTVLPPGSGSATSSSRALGLLRTLTLKPGNVLPLYLCPPGTIVHNISLSPSGKMQLCRSAGTFGQVVSHGVGRKDVDGESGAAAVKLERANIDRGWTLVKLQSGEVRKLHPSCVATVGTVSNKEHQQEQIGKAGRARWMGRKPRVRGLAMNACDHPHGGGRGKSKGNKHPRSVYGWLTRGKRTRRPKDKDGNKMVVTERPRGRASRS